MTRVQLVRAFGLHDFQFLHARRPGRAAAPSAFDPFCPGLVAYAVGINAGKVVPVNQRRTTRKEEYAEGKGHQERFDLTVRLVSLRSEATHRLPDRCSTSNRPLL
jgi:hypothetical protein